MYFHGIQIVTNNYLTKGVSKTPKKKHKSKRIQKKWLKRYGYKPIPDPNIYYVDGKYFGHPITIKKVIRNIQNEVRRK